MDREGSSVLKNADCTIRSQFEKGTSGCDWCEESNYKDYRWLKQRTSFGQFIGCVHTRKKRMTRDPLYPNSKGRKESNSPAKCARE